jgi:hypothetical protein
MDTTLIVFITLIVIAIIAYVWSTNSRENFNMATPDSSTFNSVNGIGPVDEDDVTADGITKQRKKPCNCK